MNNTSTFYLYWLMNGIGRTTKQVFVCLPACLPAGRPAPLLASLLRDELVRHRMVSTLWSHGTCFAQFQGSSCARISCTHLRGRLMPRGSLAFFSDGIQAYALWGHIRGSWTYQIIRKSLIAHARSILAVLRFTFGDN